MFHPIGSPTCEARPAAAFAMFPFAACGTWYEHYWLARRDRPHCPRRLRCRVGRMRRRLVAALGWAPAPPACPVAAPIWLGARLR